MDTEEKRILAETHRLVLKLVRAERWRTATWWIKWLVILGVTGWLYLKIAPWLKQLLTIYQTVIPGLQNLQLPF